MKQEKRVPKRRFRAFAEAGEWQHGELHELAEFDPSCVLPDSFEYVDLESVSGSEIISHRTEYRGTAPSRAQRVAQAGDVFYQTVRPYQKNNCKFKRSGDWVFSTGYAQLRPYVDSDFLLAMLQNDSFVNDVMKHCTGTSYPAISDNDLARLTVCYPAKKAEQQKIGMLFRSIDRLLYLHDRKLQKLEHLKQAYLAEMFPAKGERQPRRRFEGFSGDWEGKTLGDLLAFSNGFNGSREMYGHGIKYISVMDILNNDYIVYDNIRGQVDVSAETAKAFAVTYGDVLFQRSSETFDEAGTSNVYVDADRPAVFGGFVICGTKVEEYDPFFMKHLLDTKPVRHQIISTAQGAQHINVGQESLSHVQIFLPSMNEQQKIGAFFRIMDKKLQSEQQKLAKLRALKQAYLSELFV